IEPTARPGEVSAVATLIEEVVRADRPIMLLAHQQRKIQLVPDGERTAAFEIVIEFQGRLGGAQSRCRHSSVRRSHMGQKRKFKLTHYLPAPALDRPAARRHSDLL